MTLINKISLVFLTFWLSIAVAPVFADDFKWREITPAELALKTPMVDPTADAEAIFWEIRINGDSQSGLIRDNYFRIKIFTERGREKYSKFDIPYLPGTKIKDIAARVIKPDGTIIPVNQSDIFDRDVVQVNKAKIKAKSFAAPNIEIGSIIEYHYREINEDAGAIGLRLDFQLDIPVETLSYYYKAYNKKEPQYEVYNLTDTKFIKDEKDYYLAQRKNIPAFVEEPMMPPKDTLRPWIELKSEKTWSFQSSGKYAKFVIANTKDITTEKYWKEFGEFNSSLLYEMNAPNEEIKAAAEKLTASAAAPEEKIAIIYNFCQTEIVNTDFPVKTDSDAAAADKKSADNSANRKEPKIVDILRNKRGSSGYIRSLFGAMAHSLGFETQNVYASDRSRVFFKPELKDQRLLHRAAVAVKLNAGWKLFNPGMPFLQAARLSWYEEDAPALMIGSNFITWITTPLSDTGDTVAKRTGRFKLLEDGTLEGTATIEYTGQLGRRFKLENYNQTEDRRNEILTDEIKDRLNLAEVSDIKVINAATPGNAPFTYSFKIRVPNYAQKTGKRLFFQPGFFESGGKPLFSSSARKYDVYFNYPWSEKDDIEIELPKGYALDSPDAPAEISDPKKIGDLSIKIFVANNSTLKYKRNFYFGRQGSTLFPAAGYPAIKELFDEFHKADAHLLTLKQN